MHVSVSEAKAQLTDLVRRAEEGEEIVLTRHGHPVVALKALRPEPRAINQADLDWLAANRVTPVQPPAEDAGVLVSRMRDEDWER
jgi:antitoxin (DNA-binding transcriptional repressor) of toxin-antitoxin stability system